jgi:putative ABC transport system permease protein
VSPTALTPAGTAARPATETARITPAALRWLSFAWRNTWRNRRRSAATVAITALGTAALLLAGGFALYTYESLAQASARSTGHLVLAQAAQFERDEDTPLQHGLAHWTVLRERLLFDEAVRHVLPRVEFSGLISNGDKSTVMMAVGISPDDELSVKGPFLTITAGQALAQADRASVMLGEGLARSLKAAPGSGLTLLASTTEGALNALDVTVKGVFATGVPEMDKRLVYTDVATAQRLLVSDKVSSLGVFLSRMEATEPARERLAAAAPGLALRTWEEQAFFYRSVKALYNRIFGALGLIIGVIVVVVVSNAMAMAIVERTREIGTLRALGTLPRQLVASLGLEGLLLGGAGVAAGTALALLVALGLMVFPVQMPPPPGRSVGYPLQVAIDPTLYGLTVAAMLGLAVIASALVARRTVRLPVAQALAHV